MNFDPQSNLLTFFTTINKLSCIHALSSYECFCSHFVSVWITESDLSQGSTTAGIVNYVLKIDETLCILGNFLCCLSSADFFEKLFQEYHQQ